jgi:hypothetical protein
MIAFKDLVLKIFPTRLHDQFHAARDNKQPFLPLDHP